MATTYGANYLKRMQNHLVLVAKRVPDVADQSVAELGELLVDLIPFVDSGEFDKNIDQPVIDGINENDDAFYSALRASKYAGVNKELETIYKLTKSSVKETNAEGDKVLIQIADKCLEVAQKLA